jgi:branched-chain amino acid transport system substrate-binding protein
MAMRGILCLILIAGVFAPGVLSAEEPIKIGFMYILSGRASVFGTVAKQGAELALEEINKAGGINGRQLLGSFQDTQGKPQESVEMARDLVMKEKVRAIIGIVSSSVAEALVPVMKELRVPLIITTATTPLATGRDCNRYTFRVTWSTDQSIKSAALIAAKTGARKWTTVGPNYLLGYETWDLFQKYMSQENSKAEFLSKDEVVFAPMDTTDWKPLLEKVVQSGADGIVVSLWGGNAIDFLRQGKDMGFFDGNRTVLMTVGGSMDVFVGMRTSMPQGVWFGTPYWFSDNKTSTNSDFVRAYEAKFQTPPSYMAQTAYVGVKLYAEGLKRAGNTEGDEVAKAMESVTFEMPVGLVRIRREDHQALFPIIWGKTSEKVVFTLRDKPFRDLDSITRFSPEDVTLSPEASGCRME